MDRKQGRRPHFVVEWANSKRLRQSDLANSLNIDKSLISRWYAGATPGQSNQEKLAALFGCKRADIFMHPDEAWFHGFITGRSAEEVLRIKLTLETAFPRKESAP